MIEAQTMETITLGTVIFTELRKPGLRFKTCETSTKPIRMCSISTER